MCCMYLSAQNNELDTTLKNLYTEFWTRKADEFDTSKVGNVLSLITESNYNSLSDSAKYIYHYFSAGIYHDKEDRDNELVHIEKAVRLSESTMGILNPEYLELLMEQGSIMEGNDIDKAILIYQKGVLIGQTIINNPKAQTFHFRLFTDAYGNIMSALAELYDKKGWTSRIDELYKTAFRYRTYYSPKNEAPTYVDLYMLANYYERKNDINKSIEIMEWEKEYIKENGFYGSSAYVEALYFLGSYYSKANLEEKSLDAYRTAVKIACDSLGGMDETLLYLYGNYCIKLAELNQLNELDNILPTAKSYYVNIDTLRYYSNILYEITDRLNKNRQYDLANKYCDSLLLYQSYYADHVELAYSQKALIEYNCNNIDSALIWKKRQLESNTEKYGINSNICFGNINDVAFLYNKLGLHNEARQTYIKLRSLLENSNCDTIPLYYNTISSLINIYERDSNQDLAYSLLLECKQSLFNKYGTHTLTYALICNSLSVLEIKNNNYEEAKKNNKIAEDLFLEIEGEISGNYAAALHNKGRILMLEEKYKQALSTLVESKRIQTKVNGKIAPNTEKYIQEIKTKLK